MEWTNALGLACKRAELRGLLAEGWVMFLFDTAAAMSGKPYRSVAVHQQPSGTYLLGLSYGDNRVTLPLQTLSMVDTAARAFVSQ